MEKKIYFYLNEINKMQNGNYVNPISCEIDISNKCMLNCSFCMYKEYRKNNNVNLDKEIYRKLLYELKEIGVKSITFTGGGEPLMNPDFNDMFLSAKILGFEIGLITNGVKLNEVKNPDMFKFIRVSLDSSDSITYHRIKGRFEFNNIINNIEEAIEKNAKIGLSYVVCRDNKRGISMAEYLAEKLKVKYIQFKPAWIKNKSFEFNTLTNLSDKTIVTNRYKAENKLPCKIAGLIGIVGADSNVYFCCQHRGKEKFKLGSLKENNFEELWRKRLKIMPDISCCPQCRYMNYTRAYEVLKEKSLFFEHKNFL